MIEIMKPLKPATTRRPLSPSATNHILWGIVCFGLILFVVAMWQNIQTLTEQNNSLKKEVVTLKARETTCTARDTWEPGTTKIFNLSTADGPRFYGVHLPKNFNKSLYYPLVVNYPGKGTSAMGGIEQTQLSMLPLISAYPFPTQGKDGYTAWQGAPYSSGADDVGFTAEMLDKIQSRLCIDRARIYATGMSNGGGMVSLLSCQLPNRFAAFGIVSGALYYPAGNCKPTQPAPIINIHGDNDPNVPYTGSAARGLPSINSWAAERARYNSCAIRPTVVKTDVVTTVTTWNDCKNNATVESVRLHGGGHIWNPGATQMLWRFMSKHTL